MDFRYIKAAGYLLGFCGLGYVLLETITLSDNQMKELKPVK